MQRITGLEPRATMAKKVNDALMELEKRVAELEAALAKTEVKKPKKADAPAEQ